jgi:hypothetical protein
MCVTLLLVGAPFASGAGEALQHFDFKAQPLSEALMAFGAQTGAIVMAPSELTNGKTSKSVTGQLTTQDALTRMLLGTGLEFQKSTNGTILIVRAFAGGLLAPGGRGSLPRAPARPIGERRDTPPKG